MPTATAGSIPPDNLILRLRLDEGIGIVATDTGIYGQGGTLTGTVGTMWVRDGLFDQYGALGYCVFFDGTDDYITTPLIPDIMIGDNASWSMAFWLYPTSISGNRVQIGCNNSMTDTFASAQVAAALWLYYGNWSASMGYTLIVSTWVHVIYTYDSDTNRLICYINGVVKYNNTIATNGEMTTNNLYFGGLHNNSVVNPVLDFAGRIEHPIIANVSWSYTEALGIYGYTGLEDAVIGVVVPETSTVTESIEGTPVWLYIACFIIAVALLVIVAVGETQPYQILLGLFGFLLWIIVTWGAGGFVVDYNASSNSFVQLRFIVFMWIGYVGFVLNSLMLLFRILDFLRKSFNIRATKRDQDLGLGDGS